MPPSPAMRSSHGREFRGDNHKRGRSLEGGILFGEKDDDLALFNEMQTRERDNFLLKSNDDFEDLFSTKLRYFSDYNLGISIPVRGENSDLLNADGEKHDYDWLLTPPDTPLFRSLDDETPPVTFAQRGRPRSQPITISRSSTMEKSHRSSRGSASPNRSSPSPRSGNSTIQTRGRASSAPHSSPTPSLRNATPTRRPSPPPSKSATPVPRSLTPTPRRMSTGSGGSVSSSGVRGTSPVSRSRGNSASPKVSAWKTNIPGFSLDAPPNLRTSLADRPASYVRGSSPASRNGRDSSSRCARQSMSPTASRSISSSRSKGSVASSGDDDVDSLQSVPMSSSDISASRRVGGFSSNKAPAFSKKPTRTGLSSSAPKRSFDSALRQMDHRKGPQNMFRPLLSSVPSSTFYAGKVSAAHRALISRNSSVTTSSNASSDQCTSGAHDTEGSEQNQDDMASECGKARYTGVQDDVFAFEKADGVNERTNPGVHDQTPDVQRGDFSGGAIVDSQLGGSQDFGTPMAITATSEASEVKDNFPEVDGIEAMALCSKCGLRYHAMDLTEGDLKLCADCRRIGEPLTATSSVPTTIVSENFPSLLVKISDEHVSFDALDPLLAMLESSEVTNIAEARAAQHEENVQKCQTTSAEPSLDLSSENCFSQKLTEEDVQNVIGQLSVGHYPSDGDPGVQKMQHLSEGAGISILLKRSSSGTGPVVQGRTFTATTIAYDDPSYVRESAPSMRSSIGHGSVSASSSVDMGPARQMETRVQRQLSGKKSDFETYRYDMNSKHQRTGSSLSGTLSHAFQGLSTNTNEESIQLSVALVENEVVGVTKMAPGEQSLASENAGLNDICVEVVCNNYYGTMAASTSEISTNTLNICSGDSSFASFSYVEDSASCGNGEVFQNDMKSILDQETSALTLENSTVKEDTMLTSLVDRVDVAGVSTQSSLDTISEIELENGHLDLHGSESDIGSPNSRNTMDELPEPSVAIGLDNDILASVAEPDTLDHAHGFPEESTVTVEGHGGTRARSLTLDEATDTILFCSSIIHNLAYEAATIAMENESSVPLEGSRPMVTIVGNSNSDRKDPRGRTAGKRNSKSQKSRQKRVEMDTKPLPCNTDSVEKVDVSTTRIVGVPERSDSMKPPKIESKCNCTIM
ncbi:Serine-rich adhesin for platelets like [Actinidia chinensis var. chinensis]|uniref:Serine-rich adhesin for platelets like n=1 Tax=Actinidia chinensis var. chinensis TaxID=1590841 RepID=A0A2R6REF3_ACTCC|nr:Serine-rich adhesin for platelets like [Actinidia chinensis var. chinensis]